MNPTFFINQIVIQLEYLSIMCYVYIIQIIYSLHLELFCLQVDGKEVPGPLFDFGLLMYHCGPRLFSQNSGPYFYLSKVNVSLTNQMF